MKNVLKNRKGQGTTEYVVILAIAVALAATIFWPAVKGVLTPKVTAITQGIQSAGN